MLNTLDDWLDFIGHQHTAEIVMGLDRVRTVWTRLEKPRATINIIVYSKTIDEAQSNS